MLDRKIDNLLNKINKQLERVANSLGTASQLYQRLASVIRHNIPNAFIKKKGKAIQVERSESLNNLPQYVIDGLEARYDSTALSKEKETLKAHIEAERYLNNPKKIGKGISKREYQNMARIMNEASHDIDTAIKYLYAHQDSPEYKTAMNILESKGRKSYETLTAVIDQAVKLMQRTGDANTAGLSIYVNRTKQYSIWRMNVNPYYNTHPNFINPQNHLF